MIREKKFSTFTLILLALLCLIMPACSSQDDVISPEKAEAPTDATGEFKFYKGDNLKWSFKVLPASDPTSSVVLINSTTAQVNGTGTFYYQRINETSASVSCFFVTRIAIGGNVVGQWNQYELTLTFLSAHHGYFTGVEKKNPEDSGTEIRGRFVYDSEMELEEILKEYGDDNNDNSNVNWSCLTKHDWLYRISDNSWTKYSFYDDGKVVYEVNQRELTKLSGTYVMDKNESILRITFGDITEFEVLSLDDNFLKICNTELGLNYVTTYKAMPKQDIPKGNVNISAPELNVTGSTLHVKGTILSDIGLDSKGAIISFEPNGNIDKCEERVASSSNIVDLKFKIAAGYKYYVRLFAKIKGGDYVYGEEKEITAPGEKIEELKFYPLEIRKHYVKIRAEVPQNVKKFGLCWGTSPHPKVTDYFIEESNENRIWIIEKNLNEGTTYYIRAYDITGTDITYFENSEIEFTTVGKKGTSPTFSTSDYSWTVHDLHNLVNVTVNYSDLPQGTNKITVYLPIAWGNTRGTTSFYTDNSYGIKRFTGIDPLVTNKVWYVNRIEVQGADGITYVDESPIHSGR